MTGINLIVWCLLTAPLGWLYFLSAGTVATEGCINWYATHPIETLIIGVFGLVSGYVGALYYLWHRERDGKEWNLRVLLLGAWLVGGLGVYFIVDAHDKIKSTYTY